MKLKSEKLSPPTDLTKINYLTSLDWGLQNADTRYATHSFHPYSAKYIPQIPHQLISVLSEKNDFILDNFMGSGTTLVEAKILGRNAIGIDINPLACLVAKVKTTNIYKSELEKIPKISLSIKKDILKLRREYSTLFSLKNKEFTPIINSSFVGSALHLNIPKWFHENVIRELLVIKSHIELIEEMDIRDFFLVAFSSILRSISNATSGFGNLMLNKQAPPKGRIYEKFNTAINEMVQNMNEFNKIATNSDIKILNHD